MKTTILTTVLVLLSLGLFAQVGINTDGSEPDPSAGLDVSFNNKGFLMPRLDSNQIVALVNPAFGLMVFNTSDSTVRFYNGDVWKPLELGIGADINRPWQCGDTIDDARDGSIYNTVQIGNQCWMSENLNYNQSAFGGDWCYGNNSANCDTYGRLYTWAAVMQGASSSNTNPSGVQGVCPGGWHVPSDAEWTELTTYVGNNGHSGTEGTALKSTSGWNYGGNGTDNFGFTGLPGGDRFEDTGSFNSIGDFGNWWSSRESSSSNAWIRYLYYNNGNVSESHSNKQNGFSVRCLRD